MSRSKCDATFGRRRHDIKDITVINFNSPRATRDRFDALCRASGKTRTAVLVELMEGYILTQARVLAERKRELSQVDQSLERRGQNSTNWHNGPPELFRTDGINIW